MRIYRRKFPTAIEASAYLEGINTADTGDFVAYIARESPCIICVEDYTQEGDDDPFNPSEILLSSKEKKLRQERLTDEHRALEIGRLVIDEVAGWGSEPILGGNVVGWLVSIVQHRFPTRSNGTSKTGT